MSQLFKKLVCRSFLRGEDAQPIAEPTAEHNVVSATTVEVVRDHDLEGELWVTEFSWG